MRIVFADDEPDIRSYFRRLLPRWGHEVVGEATNGRELVECCCSERPDLIITDIQMGKMDGIEATTEIAKTQSIPIIVVSSIDPPKTMPNPLIIDYLVKPIQISDLKAAIAKGQHAVMDWSGCRH